MALKLTPSIFAELRQHGEQTYPHECCGILLGTIHAERDERTATLVIRCGNTRTDSPANRYNIHPKELIATQKLARQRGEDIIGFYHSHPDHPAHWSPTDLAEAHWIGCSYVITAVANGKAVQTNSFALAGTVEEDKHFAAEPVVITGSAAASAETARHSSSRSSS